MPAPVAAPAAAPVASTGGTTTLTGRGAATAVSTGAPTTPSSSPKHATRTSWTGSTSSPPTPGPTPGPRLGVGNPLTGTFYADPNAWAAQVSTRTTGAVASTAHVLATIPQAKWIGPSDQVAWIRDYVDRASALRQLPVLVLYAIPGRDCGGFSSGGFTTSQQYLSWVTGVRTAIGARPTTVIVEPDALASGACTASATAVAARLATLAGAVDLLTLDPTTAVYLDAGHQQWLSAAEAASLLRAAHVDRARGFSLDVSNFYPTSEEVTYGNQVSVLLGGSHFVIDSSRNGNGPAAASPLNWCNPTGRLLGHLPQATTDGGAFDGYLWIKHPGESDGTCNRNEPGSGTWFSTWAIDIVTRSLALGLLG